MKRFSSFLVIITIVSILLGSFAFAEETTQQGQAVALKDISIFKGDSNGFNLSGRLKRSEAATLIVRMLGDEATVVANKSAQTVTVFADVKEDDWFAPYVGYCYRNGIILGFPDGTFKPNDYISEKAFTQLILGVMNYKSGTDFTWETINRFAFDKKLVSDVSYTVSTDDNTNYTRGQSVTLMYKCLSQKKKNTDKSVAEFLVDKKVTTRTKAKKYGFITEDEVKTAIESIKVKDADSIVIEMNESVLVNADDVKIFANDVEITITNFTTKNNDILIDVKDELYNERTFKVVIDKLYDEAGYEIKNLEKTFDGMEREAIESKFFKISKIKPLSSEMLEVSFTQPVDDKAKQVLLYSVYKNGALYFEGSYKTLDVQLNSINNKSIILISKQHKFEANSKYKVVIKSDLKSTYSSYLNNGQGDSYEFYGVVAKVKDFGVEEARLMDTDTIIIRYSDVVDKESALNRSNYYLIDEDNRRISPKSITLDEHDEDSKFMQVIIEVPDTKEYHEYTINIDDVDNLFKTARISNYTKDLGDGIKENDSVYLSDIEALNRTLLKLTFDTPLVEASEKAVIDINKSIDIRKILFDKNDPKALYLYLAKGRPLVKDKDYDLVITKGIEDIYGNKIEEKIEENFEGVSELPDPIYIESANFISDSQIVLKFSEAVREGAMKNEKNYTFEYSINGNDRKLFPGDIELADERTVIIDFDYYIQGGQLYLTVEDVYDYSGQYKIEKLSTKIELFENN